MKNAENFEIVERGILEDTAILVCLKNTRKIVQKELYIRYKEVKTNF